MLLGGSVLGIWKPNINKVVMINLMNIIIGITFSWSGWLTAAQFLFFAILTAVGGVAASLYNASFTTLIQEEIKPNMLGRVFSLYYSLIVIPSVVGLLCTGFIADFIGISQTFVILGLLISLVGVVSFFTPSLMKLGSK
jgi:DHA3 family macrolide efflux protein-like MFS transporter